MNLKTILNLFRESVGLPSYRSGIKRVHQDISLHVCVFRALQRFIKVRTVCFLRIWRKTEYSFAIRIVQTYVLFVSSVDLMVTVFIFIAFSVLSNNAFCRWLHLPIIMTVFGFFYQQITVIPLILFFSINAYAFVYWLFCMIFPLYKERLHYNLTYNSLTQLGGDLPGNWAWKSLAMLYGYLIVRLIELYIKDLRVLKTTGLLLKESGLDFSPTDFIDVLVILREVTPSYLEIAEIFLVNCVMSCVEFIHLLITVFF